MATPQTYRIKTVRPQVRAMKWDGSPESAQDIIAWVLGLPVNTAARYVDAVGDLPDFIAVRILTERLLLRTGYYLVRGNRGDFAVVEGGLFEDTYELVP